MDDSLIIYSSLFILAGFIFLFKFLKYNVVVSIVFPLLLVWLFNLFRTSNVSTNDLDMLTEMPNF